MEYENYKYTNNVQMIEYIIIVPVFKKRNFYTFRNTGHDLEEEEELR